MPSTVEKLYQERMDSLKPMERMERCVSMLNWTRELIGRQISVEMGPMTTERLKWEVAKRLYGADPLARAMIERKLEDVSR